MYDINCAHERCEVSENLEPITGDKHQADRVVTYVGDPMCSWCYGIAPVVEALQTYCDAHQIGFEIVVGGLRSGGKDQWSESFKIFLRQTWQKIAEATGQRFNFGLLETPFFDYNTEPSCRAVVVAQSLLPADNQHSLVQFLTAVQTQFYFENQDPKEVHFYQSICEELNLDFAEFTRRFESAAAKEQTVEQFRLAQRLGVSAFPTFLWRENHKVTLLTAGYTSLPSLIRKIETHSRPSRE